MWYNRVTICKYLRLGVKMQMGKPASLGKRSVLNLEKFIYTAKGCSAVWSENWR